jgi:hypothetical protein
MKKRISPVTAILVLLVALGICAYVYTSMPDKQPSNPLVGTASSSSTATHKKGVKSKRDAEKLANEGGSTSADAPAATEAPTKKDAASDKSKPAAEGKKTN